MKINCGPTPIERQTECLQATIARQGEWHPWFAWYPVRVGSSDCRWLESVLRCRGGEVNYFCVGNIRWNDWQYRAGE